jgi:hypothetical protein
MILSEEEIIEILKSYKWIKVKRYVEDTNLSWEERYHQLEEHHIEETNFLIEKIRSIVEKIKEENEKEINQK